MKIQDQMDREANEFAMHLLMPETVVRKEVSKLGGIDLCDDKKILELAGLFRVPSGLMAIRIGQIYTKTMCLVALLFLVGCGCQSDRGFPPEHQIRNFDRVTPEVWRGSQPNSEGFRWLASQGCKTVVCLSHVDEMLPNERELVESLGMRFVFWPMSGSHAPAFNDMTNLQAVLNYVPSPVLVHCLHGCDRTGTVIACWRIKHGWTAKDALREADAYGMSKWEWGMRSFIKGFKP